MTSLQNAPALYVGTTNVSKVYLGDTQVWPTSQDLTSEMRQQQTGTWDGAGFTVTLPQAPAETSTLVLIVAGNTTVATPAGWTLRQSQVEAMGHYLYTCTDTTATSWNVISNNGAGTWWIAEVTNAAYDVASGSRNAGVGHVSYATPTITPGTGSRMLIASIGASGGASVRTVAGWTNDFTEVADICQPSWDYPMQGVATRIIETSGSDGYQTQASYSVQGSASAIICALTVNAVANSSGISPLAMGHGGPILLVTKPGRAFNEYYSEILRAEGLNSFDTIEIGDMDNTVLTTHDIVLLGEMSLTNGEVATLEDWVDNGGKLIAMRPDKKLASLLGIVDASATFSDTYIKIDTSTAPGLGITGQTMQYHGTADRYTLAGGTTAVAALCSDATTETVNPAVTLREVGGNGGVAVAFTYDLARSVTLTHQGNPAWAGQDRNGDGLVRPNDLFHGAMTGDNQPDYVDLNKVAIPQADEQQRLLANIINEINKETQPLPKFSYLPYNDKAAIVMVCDDHATPNAVTELNYMIAESPLGGSVEDWECVRATSLMYINTPLTDGQVAGYAAQGFDFGVHMNTGGNWTTQSLIDTYNADFTGFQAKYTSIPPQRVNRNHSIVWNDYTTMAKEGLNHGVRLDLNYYYWPGSWVQNRPGFMNGSGMVMRFADTDGSMIDSYQLASHLVNESGQTWPQNIDLMLERALGPEEYYGILGTHYDYSDNFDRQLIQSAKAHGVRLVSGEQILNWTDGRNASYFTPGSWSGTTYSFTATVDSEMRQMGRILLPMSGKDNNVITDITRDGVSQSFTVETMKGVSYAVFTAASGTYEVTYGADTTPPTVTGVVPATGATDPNIGTDVRVTFSEPLNPATVTTANVQLLDDVTPVTITVSYDAGSNTIIATPTAQLTAGTTYTIQIDTGVEDANGVALAATYTSWFVPIGEYSIWAPAAQSPSYDTGGSVELGLRFQSSQAGEITQIKFYKSPSDNLSTHTVTLWSPGGAVMATGTTSSETGSGWQTATLSAPVVIDANTTYTASFLASSGYYCYTSGGLTSAVTNGPLTALVGGGVYAYPSGRPTDSFGNANYWVDVAFVPQ